MREFARAVFSSDPLNFDPTVASAAGYADVVAPPTFAVVVQESTLKQLLAEPDAGIDFSRVVHGDQRFSYSRPIVAGDELTATLSVTSTVKFAVPMPVPSGVPEISPVAALSVRPSGSAPVLTAYVYEP